MTSREIAEGAVVQGMDESIVYSLTTTKWGSSPTSVSVKVYSINPESGAATDVTSTVMPSGSASVSGDIISLPALTALSIGVKYRVEVNFTCSGNVFEAYAYVQGES